ncbi:hypothetical protein Acr_02g0011820 [Actinidia rufa]|uniref:UDP-Glycosyltransferase superfamily protein n=1 Tax=Actinidia rufa TaxID=165716 RepID=A0A7J0E9F8_9ERIC|nr:hypothetical protein Acr_02g0011820 [Actinidia rufa]
MGKPHVLAIPYPAQDDMIPPLELVQCPKFGFKVNTEFNHTRVTNALLDKQKGSWKSSEKINGSDDDKITCIIADEHLGWPLEFVENMGIRRVAFWPAAAALLALGFSISKLIDAGITNDNDMTDERCDAYPKRFRERVATRGRIVGLAPQHKVLSHHSVACFLSHCDWNSTVEGLSNGVPFLCWPYFGDQFLNQSYICDVWKVGLGLIEMKVGSSDKETCRTGWSNCLTIRHSKKGLWIYRK